MPVQHPIGPRYTPSTTPERIAAPARLERAKIMEASMRVLAKATRTQLMEFTRRGLAPKDAVNALLAEAKRRYPEYETVIIQPTTSGFDIVGL